MPETKKVKRTSAVDLRIRIEELENENERLKSLLLTDELTGLYNKRFFYMQLEVETARTRRTGQTCTLIAMDLDNFKNVNDTFGHYTGDQLLTQFAGVLSKNVRPTDFACRFGGDEFFVIMPSSGVHESLHVSKRIQSSLQNGDFASYAAHSKRVSVSIGLAAYEPFHAMSIVEFLQKADANLLSAKKLGKNRIFHDMEVKMTNTAVNDAERRALSMNFATIDEMDEK
jgi:diguanylate cyclase (GGDEF)-like protein